MLGAPNVGETRKLLVDPDEMNKLISSNDTNGDFPEITKYIDEKTDKRVAAFINMISSGFIIGGIILTIAAALFVPIL